MKKRVPKTVSMISVILAMLVSLAFASVNASAEERGEEKSLSITAESPCPGVKSLAFVLSYDHAALEFVGGAWTLSGVIADVDTAKDAGVIAFVSEVTASGKICEVTFRVKDNAPSGIFPVSAKLVVNSSGRTETIALGTVTVAALPEPSVPEPSIPETESPEPSAPEAVPETESPKPVTPETVPASESPEPESPEPSAPETAPAEHTVTPGQAPLSEQTSPIHHANEESVSSETSESSALNSGSGAFGGFMPETDEAEDVLPDLSEATGKTTEESEEASDEPEAISEEETLSEAETEARDSEETPHTAAAPFPWVLLIAGVLSAAGIAVFILLKKKRNAVK